MLLHLVVRFQQLSLNHFAFEQSIALCQHGKGINIRESLVQF